MIGIINVPNIHHCTVTQFFSYDENFQDLFSDFEIYNRALLTIVTMLYVTLLELTYLVTGSLYFKAVFTAPSSLS